MDRSNREVTAASAPTQRWFCALAVASLGLLVSAQDTPEQPVSSPALRKGKVTANILNVRARPGMRYEVLCQLKAEEEVSVVSEQDGWVELLLPPRAKAWIAEQYVDDAGLVIGDRVRVHSGPGLVFTTYAHLNKGDRAEKQDEPKNGWQRINAPERSSGWVSAEYIEIEEPPPPEPEPKPEPAKAVPPVPDPGGFPGAPQSPDTIQAPPGFGFKAPPMAGGTEEAVIRSAPAMSVAPVPPDPGPSTPGPAEGQAAKIEQPVARLTVTVDAKQEGPAGKPEPEGDEVTQSGTTGAPAPEDPAPALPPTDREQAAVPVAPPVTAEGQQGHTRERESAPAEPEAVSRDGVVLALEHGQTSEVATHMLSKRVRNTFYPVCYLRCRYDAVDLGEWEFRDVRVYGREIWYPGWEKAVIDVTGIQLRKP